MFMAELSELAEVLVCPKCLGKLTLDEDFLICPACGLKYPIDDDIPILLIDQAVRVSNPDDKDLKDKGQDKTRNG
jgi:uncharacterized protein YbaR (Trm112 family)